MGLEAAKNVLHFYRSMAAVHIPTKSQSKHVSVLGRSVNLVLKRRDGTHSKWKHSFIFYFWVKCPFIMLKGHIHTAIETCFFFLKYSEIVLPILLNTNEQQALKPCGQQLRNCLHQFACLQCF